MPFIRATNQQNLFVTKIRYFERHCLAVCDYRCDKAWGISGDRPELSRGSDDVDDVIWFADDEVAVAPDNPGSFEGGFGKPMHPQEHNKWCVRECERSDVIEIGESISCPDWSHRVYNQPHKHNKAGNPRIETGVTFQE